MNPMVDIKGSEKKSFFGKHLIQGFINQKSHKPWQYSVMKKKQITARRKKNKMARRSRRINRLYKLRMS